MAWFMYDTKVRLPYFLLWKGQLTFVLGQGPKILKCHNNFEHDTLLAIDKKKTPTK
jgi:hypothetical protein